METQELRAAMERLARIEGQSRRLPRAALGINEDKAPVVEIYGDDDSVVWKAP